MSTFESDTILELDEMLDPTRLAAAWQVAHERTPVAAARTATATSDAVDPSAPAGAASPDDTTGAVFSASAASAASAAGARPAALPVALAHRQFLDELERTLAASPGLAANAHRVLAVPLARLAALIDPTEEVSAPPGNVAAGPPGAATPGIEPPGAGAADAVLDELEDLLQALLSAAGWPASGEE